MYAVSRVWKNVSCGIPLTLNVSMSFLAHSMHISENRCAIFEVTSFLSFNVWKRRKINHV